MNALTDADVRPARKNGQKNGRLRKKKHEKPKQTAYRLYGRNRTHVRQITQKLKRGLKMKVSNSDSVRLAIDFLHSTLFTGDEKVVLDSAIIAAWPKRQAQTQTSKKQ